jgi:hypothetical protein
VARQVLALRSDDGSSAIVGYTPPNDDPGQWHPTPPDGSPAAAAHVPAMTPFALDSSSQFRPAPPPELTSPEYAAAFNEAKALGSVNSTERTADQTLVAGLWRLPLTHHQVWNRIAQDVAEVRNTSLSENARAFALLNMSFNDGLQTSFASKFHFGLWRPVDAIRHGGLGGELDTVGDPRADGNPDTVGDPAWTTLHPATPPYPTYAGNAATIGAACATVLADVFGGDAVPFQIPWERYGFAGVTRSYAGFWAAADEEARSRVYGGIHFTFDSVAGQGIGVNVAEYVVDNYLLPRGHGQPDEDEEEDVDNQKLARGHGRGKHEGAGALGLSALAEPGLVAPPLIVSTDLFALGALTPATLGDKTPTVTDDGWLVSPAPSDDYEFTTSSDEDEENRIDLLFSEESLFNAIDADDELPWL